MKDPRLFTLACGLAALVATASASTNHIVTVGKGGMLKFDPEELKANPGDTVTYKFFSRVSRLDSPPYAES